MRIKIKFDSATTREVRDLSVALNRVLNGNELTLGVNGPEHWHGETPHLTRVQFAMVVRELADLDGEAAERVVGRPGPGYTPITRDEAADLAVNQ